jgi:hypothetical protein
MPAPAGEWAREPESERVSLIHRSSIHCASMYLQEVEGPTKAPPPASQNACVMTLGVLLIGARKLFLGTITSEGESPWSTRVLPAATIPFWPVAS